MASLDIGEQCDVAVISDIHPPAECVIAIEPDRRADDASGDSEFDTDHAIDQPLFTPINDDAAHSESSDGEHDGECSLFDSSECFLEDRDSECGKLVSQRRISNHLR